MLGTATIDSASSVGRLARETRHINTQSVSQSAGQHAAAAAADCIGHSCCSCAAARRRASADRHVSRCVGVDISIGHAPHHHATQCLPPLSVRVCCAATCTSRRGSRPTAAAGGTLMCRPGCFYTINVSLRPSLPPSSTLSSTCICLQWRRQQCRQPAGALRPSAVPYTVVAGAVL